MMSDQEAKMLDILQTWTLQSAPRKSRKADDPDRAPVFNIDEEIDISSFWIGICRRRWVGARRIINAMMKVLEQFLA